MIEFSPQRCGFGHRLYHSPLPTAPHLSLFSEYFPPVQSTTCSPRVSCPAIHHFQVFIRSPTLLSFFHKSIHFARFFVPSLSHPLVPSHSPIRVACYSTHAPLFSPPTRLPLLNHPFIHSFVRFTIHYSSSCTSFRPFTNSSIRFIPSHIRASSIRTSPHFVVRPFICSTP